MNSLNNMDFMEYFNSNARYVVRYEKKGMHFDERMGFIEYETEKEALEKVNKLMIEGNSNGSCFNSFSAREFLYLCAEDPEIWGDIALYNFNNDWEKEEARAYGYR